MPSFVDSQGRRWDLELHDWDDVCRFQAKHPQTDVLRDITAGKLAIVFDAIRFFTRRQRAERKVDDAAFFRGLSNSQVQEEAFEALVEAANAFFSDPDSPATGGESGTADEAKPPASATS